MIKVTSTVAALAAVLWTGAASAAPTAPSGALPSAAWMISPGDGVCRTDLELEGRSGSVTPVQLISDGERLALRFTKADLPAQAFLAVRIDQKRYSNLMTRGDTAGVGELTLSSETEAALRRGATLDIAWLSAEPVGASLAGSEQGVADLRTCGLQARARARSLAAEQEADAARKSAEAHARAISEAQLAAARAEAAAAEAERQRLADEADERRARDDARRQQAAYEAQRQAFEEAERRRAWRDDEAFDGPAWERPARQRPSWDQPAWGYRY
ncbi:hypothetical protein [Phenylobacterium sp.]|uniref:hypothetical protein n=1 Tax=Phenylobacterium sp. TaxID=1871053 RepID=UPI0037834CD2